MIWQLVKRDPAWQMMPYFAVVIRVSGLRGAPIRRLLHGFG